MSADNVPAAAGAAISVNGITATTVADGGFLIALAQEAPNYVMNIEKPG